METGISWRIFSQSAHHVAHVRELGTSDFRIPGVTPEPTPLLINLELPKRVSGQSGKPYPVRKRKSRMRLIFQSLPLLDYVSESND